MVGLTVTRIIDGRRAVLSDWNAHAMFASLHKGLNVLAQDCLPHANGFDTNVGCTPIPIPPARN